MDAGQRAAWAADGMFVIRDALSVDDIRALKELVYARAAQASTYIHPEPDARGVLPVLSWGVPEDAKDLWGGNRPGSGLLGWGAPVTSLVAHPRALPCLQEAFGGRDFRLDHDYVFQLRGSAEGTQRGGLHGSLTTETITCVWELSEVTEADGGFAAVHGSHREDFEWPFPRGEGWQWPPYPPQTAHVPCQAGDCIVFSERMTHGTWPWRGGHDRISVFMKYALASEPSIGRHYEAGEYEGVGGAARRLLTPPPAGASWADPASEEAQRERERGRARL